MAGGIPIIRPLRESLAGEHIHRVHGDRQRHDQLHPHPHERGRAPLRRGPGRGAEPGLRRARPDRRRRGLRRRGQGGDHRHASPSASGWWPATSYHEGISRHHRRRHRVRRAPRLRDQAAGHRRALRRRRRPREVGVRVHPAMVPKAPPAGRRCATASTPCSSRARPWATSCSTAGAPAAARPPAPCSATSSTPPSTCARARHATDRRARPGPHPPHRRDRPRRTT